MTPDQILREHLLTVLRGEGAHMTFDEAVADFPMASINTLPPNVPYTPWHLIEHLRITQWDILEYVRDPEHISPRWPAGYWPDPAAKADAAAWNATLEAFRKDMRDLEDIVKNPDTDLYAPIPHGYDGHTILREILLVADHNAYHIGEFAILRQVMNTWYR
ncbi:MAG: DinB family protein [Anaerolineae bacterium]|nr:DinB family protein [Anaerolineae bacterium]